MSFNEMTHRQARTLAQFVNSLRGDWDAPGIEDALGKARHLAPAPDLAIAAIKAATLASNRTPAVIALTGPHWRGADATPRVRYDPRAICHVCGQPEARCRTNPHAEHDFVSVEAARAVPSTPRPKPEEAPADRCDHGRRYDEACDACQSDDEEARAAWLSGSGGTR